MNSFSVIGHVSNEEFVVRKHVKKKVAWHSYFLFKENTKKEYDILQKVGLKNFKNNKW